MENIRCFEYILAAVALYVINLIVYLQFNKGLARNAKGLQARRYLIASVISVLPIAIAQVPVTSPGVIFNALLALVCGCTYPVIFHICNHKQSPDHDHRIDIVYGIYLFGWFTAIQTVVAAIAPYTGTIVAATVGTIAGIIAFVAAMLAAVQWCHYFIYGSCFDTNGMQAAQDTDRNEAIEFIKSFSPITLAIIAIATAAMLGACVWGENLPVAGKVGIAGGIFSGAWAIAFIKYIWVGKRSLLHRTGLIMLYHDVKEYSQRSHQYIEQMDARLANLEVKKLGKESKEPHTYIMIIGESVSREYMSAYADLKENTTPWLKECMNDEEHHIVFKNAYACANQTVPTLERVLTERNQYNTKEFYESVSIIDIARKAGYTTHWYSNQGCIGVADTSITLVAKTSDVAKWTEQEVNKVQYDGSLLDFFSEIDPTKNNLIVFHLMGSHFNFINRYPAEATQWGEPGVQDNILNYKNSIHYTDSLLKKIYDYASEKLNLQAMLYFSDHGCIPDKRRTPQFDGFDFLRIPMSIHFTDSYINAHKERFDALKANKEKYFTNDLMYELFCGLIDIESNHFEKENSLAYKEYKYTLDMLLTNSGQTRVSEDNAIK